MIIEELKDHPTYKGELTGRLADIWTSKAASELGEAACEQYRTKWRVEAGIKPKEPRKLLLSSPLPPGDMAVMSAAIYSLHTRYPGEYLTAVDSQFPAVFEHNPHIVSADDSFERVDMHYHPTLWETNIINHHFLEGYTKWLSELIKRPLTLQTNKPHLYLSDHEKSNRQIKEPYALINAGYKRDCATKFAGTQTYQDVVDHFKGKVKFIQVGHANDAHKPLKGVTNLVGKTSLRELICLVYHADFIVSGVTAITWFAGSFGVPAVTMLGGRESPQWVGMPTTICLNTIGQLPCCSNTTAGCWANHVSKDKTDGDYCRLPVVQGDEVIPKCHTLVGSAGIIKAVETLLEHRPMKEIPSLITQDRLKRIKALVKEVKDLEGHASEIGVFKGGSAKVIAEAGNSTLHLFDTWRGQPYDDALPEGHHKKGDFATDLEEVRKNLRGLNVEYHVGTFPETAIQQPMKFIHIDVDSYQGTKEALRWAWSQLVQGGIIVLDDYEWEACPGVKKAIEEVLPNELVETHHMQAVIRKQPRLTSTEKKDCGCGKKIRQVRPNKV